MLTLYETFYKLSADPFRLSPDHRFSFGHRSYAKAKAYLEYALHRGEGFITITGNAGTGKTTLISEILAEIDRGRLQVATLTTTQLEGKDLLQMVAALFGLEYEDESKASLLLEIEQFLKQLDQRGRRAVLIVDEAQGLSPTAVEELRLLANLQLNHRLLLQVFLVGQEQLRDMVRAPAMEHLRQRIVAASHLEPLTLDEMVSYIEHRLLRVGWRGDPAITEDALRLIHRYSGGVPRRVNLICSRLFLYGSMEQKHELGDADARSIIEDLQQELLVSEDAAQTPAAQKQGTDAVDRGEAPPRRLPRPQPPADSGSPAAGADGKREESRGAGPGPGADMPKPHAVGEENEADIALRERDIWGEIENLEKELQTSSRGMKNAQLLGAGAVTATGQAAVRPLQQNAVGVAVSKAMSRRASAGSAAPQAREQPAAATTSARQGRPRFHTVPPRPSVDEASIPDEVTRPVLSAEPEDAMPGPRRESRTIQPPRKRRWGMVLVLLAIGVGVAGVVGWQSLGRLSDLDSEISGTIQRDATGIPETGVAGLETGADPVTVEAQEPQGAVGGGDTPGEEPVRADAAGDSGLPATAAEESLPEVSIESGQSGSAGASQSVASAAGVSVGVPQESAAEGVRNADEGEAAGGQPEPVSLAAPGTRPQTSVAQTDAGTAGSPGVAEQPTGESPVADSIEEARAKLRREAEQRFRQELGRAEAQVAQPDAPIRAPVRGQSDKAAGAGASHPGPVSATATGARRGDSPGRVSPTSAPKASASPVPASRPKNASTPAVVASAPATVIDVAPEPPRSPEQVRRLLLQGQWTSQGKPASLLPSETTFCSAAGVKIKCWSVPQKTTTKYGKALYKVEATLHSFTTEGGFELSYRTLVKLVDPADVAEGPMLGGAADDDTGWQVTERNMSCEFNQGNQVLCRNEKGTVRDYRRSAAGG